MMNKNVRAFPFYYEVKEDDEMIVMHEGMTLRDYFAGQALVGILSSPSIPSSEALKEIGVACYAMADKLMEEKDGD